MTTFSIADAIPAGKTQFATLAELYAYLVETQAVTEVGQVADVPEHLKPAYARSLGAPHGQWRNLG